MSEEPKLKWSESHWWLASQIAVAVGIVLCAGMFALRHDSLKSDEQQIAAPAEKERRITKVVRWLLEKE